VESNHYSIALLLCVSGHKWPLRFWDQGRGLGGGLPVSEVIGGSALRQWGPLRILIARGFWFQTFSNVVSLYVALRYSSFVLRTPSERILLRIVER
jgi:hypothetical protein